MTSSRELLVTIARWTTAAGAFDGVLALVAELRRRSLEEPGCLGYEVLESAESPGALVLIERCCDAAALLAHRAASHYHELLVERILPRQAHCADGSLPCTPLT